MLSLKSRQDKFRLLLPDTFVPKEINEKYTRILKSKKSFITRPIDFINESIQKIEVLGFSNATIQQTQPGRGEPYWEGGSIRNNNFMHTSSEFTYRSEVNPLQLVDKTINIQFRHSLGFINYFLMFESFWYQYCRDRKYDELPQRFIIEISNEIGSIYAKIILDDPIIDSMDMLSLDYSQPIAQSQLFQVTWKYSNINFEFIEDEIKADENLNIK